MTNRELFSILQYSFPTQLLIITHDFKLKILLCPFKVVVLIEMETLFKGQIVNVTAIKVTKDLITVYIIEKNPYYYKYFDIL